MCARAVTAPSMHDMMCGICSHLMSVPLTLAGAASAMYDGAACIAKPIPKPYRALPRIRTSRPGAAPMTSDDPPAPLGDGEMTDGMEADAGVAGQAREKLLTKHRDAELSLSTNLALSASDLTRTRQGPVLCASRLFQAASCYLNCCRIASANRPLFCSLCSKKHPGLAFKRKLTIKDCSQ